jgi:hypothetical protein
MTGETRVCLNSGESRRDALIAVNRTTDVIFAIQKLGRMKNPACIFAAWPQTDNPDSCEYIFENPAKPDKT